MPLIKHSSLPAFDYLKNKYEWVKNNNTKKTELHIGLLNIMPDKAIETTDRQFFSLISQSNPNTNIYMHPFSIKNIVRAGKAKEYVEKYYDSFEDIKNKNLDGLIITGANITNNDITKEHFWKDLVVVMDWADKNIISTIYSCLSAHASLLHRFGIKRKKLDKKIWGVFKNRVKNKQHSLTYNLNTVFQVPHSRLNDISEEAFQESNIDVLISSKKSGVHLAATKDLKSIFMQGHPEYNTISLLKEYKREIKLFLNKENSSYPMLPKNYFDTQAKAILVEFEEKIKEAIKNKTKLPEFPEKLIVDLELIENNWHDTALAIMSNWSKILHNKLT